MPFAPNSFSLSPSCALSILFIYQYSDSLPLALCVLWTNSLRGEIPSSSPVIEPEAFLAILLIHISSTDVSHQLASLERNNLGDHRLLLYMQSDYFSLRLDRSLSVRRGSLHRGSNANASQSHGQGVDPPRPPQDGFE